MRNIIYFLYILWNIGNAQSEQYPLPEIIISDNRISVPLSQTDRSVVIITQKDIQKSPVNSIEELLAHQAGIDVRHRGINGVQADVSLRGGSFEQVLILVNGTRMSDVQTGHHSMNIPVNLNSVERIEIIKGPSARRFGQNAFTGVINIITRLNSDSSLNLGMTSGEYGSFGVNTNIQSGGSNFKQSIQSNYFQTDGYRHNTDSKKTDFWYQNELRIGKHSLSLQAGFLEKKFGANGFYATPAATEQYEEIQSSLVNLQANLSFDQLEIKPGIYWRRHEDMYVFVRRDPSIYRNMHIGNTLGGALNATYKSRVGVTGIGMELREEYLSSNNLGDWSRNSLSVFLEHRFELFGQRLSITPGAMLADYNDFGSFFYPGIDIGYSINSFNRIYANSGKTYRTPTYTDLYYEDPANKGNPYLKPEEALSYEIGYKFTRKNISFDLNFFRRENKNLIDWIKQNEEDKWKPVNVAEVKTNGLEVFADYRFFNSFLNHLSFGYTYLDNEFKDTEGLISRYVLDNLKHQFTAKLNHNLIKNISLEWAYRYNYRVSLDDYHLLDAKLKWSNNRWDVFLQSNNLLNTNYTETNLIPMPGRWFSGGINCTIL
ncbi:TonB-dependent receptor plug domain-containing protein [Moheibacter sediminis]|uniref:Iron complex outermembrane recepter protein n=1 Tax=Moheibacter sediminis TaxID=1434700 RepID=A0A1W2CFK4_9FLAO|nr:TonB-dependent receptor [Moheibacter sediminis]SMC83939.1 iron complex outermembrane recepter protein [Moheibacter sediminis]